MSKFAIDPGHGDVNGSLGGDGGAVAMINEQNNALLIANKVISKLQSLGHTAFNVRPSSASSVANSLQKRCDGAANADYLVSIHLNAGGGKGSEVFAMSTAGNTLATKVLNELISLGFVNRGVKDGSGLYVIRHSNPVAILIEVCFVDTQSDVDLYNKLGIDAIANAIVKGLTGQTTQSSTPVQQEAQLYPAYDETVPTGTNIFQIPNMPFYIEKRDDGDMSIHLDRGNYMTIRKGGAPEVYWNNNKGAGGSKRLF